MESLGASLAQTLGEMFGSESGGCGKCLGPSLGACQPLGSSQSEFDSRCASSRPSRCHIVNAVSHSDCDHDHDYAYNHARHQHSHWPFMDIGSVFSLLGLSQHPELKEMSYIVLTRFLRCASMLKDDILLPQPHTISTISPPNVLPPGITEFLSRSFEISHDSVNLLWDAVKHIAWTLPSDDEERKVIEAIFQHHGQDQGIGEYLYIQCNTL